MSSPINYPTKSRYDIIRENKTKVDLNYENYLALTAVKLTL